MSVIDVVKRIAKRGTLPNAELLGGMIVDRHAYHASRLCRHQGSQPISRLMDKQYAGRRPI